MHKIKVKQSGLQSHNSLGVGERYQKPLRDTYRKLKLDHPNMQQRLLLALSVKAMDDMLGPEGFVPSSLVFGEFPILHSFLGPVILQPSLAERALEAQTARKYMAKQLAEVKIKRTLNHQGAPSSDRTISPATMC